MEKLATSVVSTREDFEHLQNEWNELLDRSRSDSVFLTWDWLHTWWCHFAAERSLYLVLVRDEFGSLIGLAPLCVDLKGAVGPGRIVTFLGTTHVSSEYLDIIALPEYESAVVNAVFRALYEDRSCWDCLLFSDLLETSLVYRYARDSVFFPKIIFKKIVSHECPTLMLSDSKVKVFENLEPQLKSTIKRKSKKFEKMGCRFEVVNNYDDLENALLSLFQLHQKCWNHRGVKGNFKEEGIKDFHRNVARLFFKRKILQLYKLSVGEDVVSTLYSFAYKNKLFYFQSGFDPVWSKYSPGTVLMWNCIEKSVENNIEIFDYLRGSEHYKSLWANSLLSTCSLRFVPKDRYFVRAYYFLSDFLKSLKGQIKKIVFK